MSDISPLGGGESYSLTRPGAVEAQLHGARLDIPEASAYLQTADGLVPVADTGSGELVVVTLVETVGELAPTRQARRRQLGEIGIFGRRRLRRDMGVLVTVKKRILSKQSFPELEGLGPCESL